MTEYRVHQTKKRKMDAAGISVPRRLIHGFRLTARTSYNRNDSPLTVSKFVFPLIV